MTDSTLPLLFINMGGEMIYILEDRLKAQKVSPEKSQKVLHDIIGMMLNERFVEELFKPQILYNKQALRSLFENLAHVSIMRLNRASMNKLYDLMVMVVKYQFFSVLRPQDILLVTMNHLEALGAQASPCITRLIENYHSKFIAKYASMQSGILQTIRHCVLNYFSDQKVKVSVLLRENRQLPDGRFVIPISGPVPAGCEVPVIIRTFSSDGAKIFEEKIMSETQQYLPCQEAGSLGLYKKHQTELGHNIYKSKLPHLSEVSSSAEGPQGDGENFDSGLLPGLQQGEPSVGYEELNLLARLLGPTTQHSTATPSQQLQLDLFPDPQEEREYIKKRVESLGSPAVMIDARAQGQTQELAALFQELGRPNETMKPADSSEDLLDLLDNP